MEDEIIGDTMDRMALVCGKHGRKGSHSHHLCELWDCYLRAQAVRQQCVHGEWVRQWETTTGTYHHDGRLVVTDKVAVPIQADGWALNCLAPCCSKEGIISV
jgi:hypothetical protein